MGALKLKVINGIEHVLLYGYFEHGFKVFCGMNIENIDDISYSEQALMISMFDSIRNKIRINTYIPPNALSGLAAFFNKNTPGYPKEIVFSNEEKIWVEKMISLTFNEILNFCNIYTSSTYYKKISNNAQQNLTFELIRNLKNAEMIDFLMQKFKQDNKLT